MGIGGGGSREWLTPLRPDGSRFGHLEGAEIRGTHTGFSAGYNVANPLPGFRYVWGCNDGRSRVVDAQKGYRPVTGEDGDMPAYMLGYGDDSTDTPTPLDTAYVPQDVVLLRIPEHVLAKRVAENRRLSERRLRLADQSFLQGATEDEVMTLGRAAPSRFSRKDHATQVRQGDQVIDHMTPQRDPSRGIMRG